MKKKILIEEMICGYSASHVRHILSEMKEVLFVDVNLKEKYAIVDTIADIDEKILKTAIDNAGYIVLGIESIKN
ncbi:MAG: heavy metal-associated domain-containing protein [Clostridiaceae bacterium]